MKQLIKSIYPKAGVHLHYIRTFVKHGTTNPSKIKLPNGNIFFADWHEPRGRQLILNNSTGQPHIKDFWKRSIDALQAHVAIDIGANYGEVIFCMDYPIGTKYILGIEANPSLSNFLQQSLAAHHDKAKMEVLNVLAGDSNNEGIDFYVDKTSSGRSTALKHSFVKDSHTVKVKSIRVDDHVLAVINPQSLVFKIDVEGFEPFVLRGMEKLFDLQIPLIGCIEFTMTALIRNDIHVDDYLNFLKEKFVVAILNRDNTTHRLIDVTKDEIINYVNNTHTETDLLLFDSDDTYNKYINLKK